MTFNISIVGPLPPSYAQSIPSFTVPGQIVAMSPAFIPLLIKGITINPNNPLRFDFIVDRGDSTIDMKEFKEESTKLIKYFLASLTIPEEDIWVNLSPYEENRITTKSLGITEMGKDLLSQDYVLKQVMASLTYPEEGLGKEFWNRVYKKAYEEYGTTDIPLNTFNKVWIMPDTAEVFEQNHTAFIVNSHLKVILEEDDVALNKSFKNEETSTIQLAEGETKEIGNISSRIAREVLLPEIEKEINRGKNFALLRQIYHSLILATWYKQRLKKSLLAQIYSDKNRIKGIDVNDKTIKDKIYQQYIETFKEGVYNFIKEDYDPHMQEVISRKYFSGGFSIPKGFHFQNKNLLANLSTEGKEGIDNALLAVEKEDLFTITTEFEDVAVFRGDQNRSTFIDQSMLTRDNPPNSLNQEQPDAQEFINSLLDAFEEGHLSITEWPDGLIRPNREAVRRFSQLNPSAKREVRDSVFVLLQLFPEDAVIIINLLGNLVVDNRMISLIADTLPLHNMLDVVQVIGERAARFELIKDKVAWALSPSNSVEVRLAAFKSLCAMEEPGLTLVSQYHLISSLSIEENPLIIREALETVRRLGLLYYDTFQTEVSVIGLAKEYPDSEIRNLALDVYREATPRRERQPADLRILLMESIPEVDYEWGDMILGSDGATIMDAGIGEDFDYPDSKAPINTQEEIAKRADMWQSVEVAGYQNSQGEDIFEMTPEELTELALALEVKEKRDESQGKATVGDLIKVALGWLDVWHIDDQPILNKRIRIALVEEPNPLGHIVEDTEGEGFIAINRKLLEIAEFHPAMARIFFISGMARRLRFEAGWSPEESIREEFELDVKMAVLLLESRGISELTVRSIVREVFIDEEEGPEEDGHGDSGAFDITYLSREIPVFFRKVINMMEKRLTTDFDDMAMLANREENIKLEPDDTNIFDDNNSTVGGIDLNSANLKLKIKRDEEGIPFPVHLQDVEHIHIEGLTPIIINITPTTIQQLPFLLSMTEDGEIAS